MLRGEGRLGRESGRYGDGADDGDNGVDGEFEARPRSFLALNTTEWTSDSGPKAKRIISFSPWSWIRRRPMIFEAFSGSRFWILESTILVASYVSMVLVFGGVGGRFPLQPLFCFEFVSTKRSENYFWVWFLVTGEVEESPRFSSTTTDHT